MEEKIIHLDSTNVGDILKKILLRLGNKQFDVEQVEKKGDPPLRKLNQTLKDVNIVTEGAIGKTELKIETKEGNVFSEIHQPSVSQPIFIFKIGRIIIQNYSSERITTFIIGW